MQGRTTREIRFTANHSTCAEAMSLAVHTVLLRSAVLANHAFFCQPVTCPFAEGALQKICDLALCISNNLDVSGMSSPSIFQKISKKKKEQKQW